MKKILFITNISNGISSFSLAALKAAEKENMEFHLAGNFSGADKNKLESDQKNLGVKLHQLDLSRSPYSIRNFNAYKQLIKLIKRERIDYIHCNTPVGGVLGRLAGKKCKVTKVIYQAHGFHFYKGAPIKNWFFYYPIERWIAHYTDAIITINKEDYQRARSFHLRESGKVYYVPGVGIDTKQYLSDAKLRYEKRKKMQLSERDIALISMGELIDRNNYSIVLDVIAKIDNQHIHYYICGEIQDEEKLKRKAEYLGIQKQIHFLGYRTDVKELLNASDIFLFTEKQEGVPRTLIEAMARGLPCVVSNSFGNMDLLGDQEGGFLCESIEQYVVAIRRLSEDCKLRREMGIQNLKRIQNFSMLAVEGAMLKTYKKELGGVVELTTYMPDKMQKRIELDIPIDSYVLISVGELNNNKNIKAIISALTKINNKSIYYIVCGSGNLENELRIQVKKNGMEKNILFLGYRSDINELLNASDIFVMPSFREGLSRSLMEAMASGLPCIVSRIRGNVDLIEEDMGGFTCPPNDIERFAYLIDKMIVNEEKMKLMSSHNLERIMMYDFSVVRKKIREIYREIF